MLRVCGNAGPGRSVNIRFREGEGVLNQFKPRLGSFGDDYFDHVEPKQNVGIIEQPQPGQAAARDPFSLVAIDRFERAAEIFARARFDFDKDERVAVAADDINFTAGAAPKITIQDFVAAPLQELAGQLLPPGSKSQMLGPRTRKSAAPPVRKIVDESDKARVHAVLSGATPSRSLCAG